LVDVQRIPIGNELLFALKRVCLRWALLDLRISIRFRAVQRRVTQIDDKRNIFKYKRLGQWTTQLQRRALAFKNIRYRGLQSNNDVADASRFLEENSFGRPGECDWVPHGVRKMYPSITNYIGN